jgi:hypothetical protein
MQPNPLDLFENCTVGTGTALLELVPSSGLPAEKLLANLVPGTQRLSTIYSLLVDLADATGVGMTGMGGV